MHVIINLYGSQSWVFPIKGEVQGKVWIWTNTWNLRGDYTIDNGKCAKLTKVVASGYCVWWGFNVLFKVHSTMDAYWWDFNLDEPCRKKL